MLGGEGLIDPAAGGGGGTVVARKPGGVERRAEFEGASISAPSGSGGESVTRAVGAALVSGGAIEARVGTANPCSVEVRLCTAGAAGVLRDAVPDARRCCSTVAADKRGGTGIECRPGTGALGTSGGGVIKTGCWLSRWAAGEDAAVEDAAGGALDRLGAGGASESAIARESSRTVLSSAGCEGRCATALTSSSHRSTRS